jgi:hypothetical protein
MHREISGGADLRAERVAEAQRAILQIETGDLRGACA